MTTPSTLRHILQVRYLIMFFCCGLQKIAVKKEHVICVVALIISYAGCCSAIISSINSPFAQMLTDIYTASMLLLGVITFSVAVWLYGAPRGYIAIMQNIYRVGIVNAASEAPVLVSRQKSKDNPKTEIWEFESYGVPFSSWIDFAEKLESALDVAITQTDPGKDGRTVLLTVIPHPGPWPTLINWNNNLLHPKNSVLVLGVNRSEQVTLDLSIIPHILTAGRSGTGKSVLQKSLMLQAVLKGMQVILVDYKLGVDYSREWHNYCEIITDDECFLSKLTALIDEMQHRYKLLIDSGYSNIDEYNTAGGSLNRVCLFVDEISECLDRSNATDKKQKETIAAISLSISSLCRLGRAAGIHVFLSTQRGSADVLSGQIRNNVFKILGSADANLSILTLGNADAAKKLPTDVQGRFMDERGKMFHGYYSDYPADVFPPTTEEQHGL